MNKQNNITDKLQELLRPRNSTVFAVSVDRFTDDLMNDYQNNKFKLFSKEEYESQLFINSLENHLISDRETFSISDKIVSLITKIIEDKKVVVLYSGIGSVVFGFKNSVGIEPNGHIAKASKLLALLKKHKAEIITDDPLNWTTEKKYDAVVSIPPTTHLTIVNKTLTLINNTGTICLVLPEMFFYGGQYKPIRDYIYSHIGVSAIISLKDNVFAPYASFKTSLLLLNGLAGCKTYLAQSKGFADLEAIAGDLLSYKKAKKQPSIGFVAQLDSQRWDVRYYEPVDYDLGKLNYPYKTVPLKEVVDINAGKASADAKLAITSTGRKMVWTDELEKLKEKNNIYLSVKDQVNPYYLFLFLNSSLGKKALDRIVKGAYIPYISSKELLELPIILPELEIQNRVVEQALSINKTIADLRTITEEGENTIKNNLFKLDLFQEKIKKFSKQTQDVAYQSLPFPIAVVYRKFVNAPNNTQRFSLMIELFESALRFIVLVNLVDYLHKMKSGEDIKQDIPLISRLTRPSLGDWVQLFNSLTKVKTNSDSEPFLKEVKEFNLDKYRKVLHEFVEMRNQSLRGHGGTLSEEEYSLKVQQYFPKLEEFIASLSFLSKYHLVKTHSLEKDGDYYKISATNLMGGTTPFEHRVIESRRPIDSPRVIYFDTEMSYLELDPFIILELCSYCKRNEVLLMDKFNGTNISYFGPESGHKPTIANAFKLPESIRQLTQNYA